MSATGRSVRGTSDTDDVLGTARGHATVPANSAFRRLVTTDARWPQAIARLTLGFVMFPHGAQKVLGWFGGNGFAGTYEYLSTKGGLPGVLAAAVILGELTCAVLLIVGALSRLAALGIAAIMIGAVVTVHAPNGFFMNWYGSKGGEGVEYHLLALGLAVAVLVGGGGAASIDRAFMRRRPAPGGSMGMQPITRD